MKIKLRKPVKISLIITGALVSLILIMAVLISPIAKWYIEKHSKDLVGRVVTMDKFSVNLFTGSLKIVNFDLKEQDEQTTFVGFDTLSVKIKLLDFLRNKVTIKKIHLSDIHLNVYQNGSKFNFDDMIEKFSATDTVQEPEDTTSSSWEVGIYDIQLRRGNILYKDLEIGSVWNIKDLNLNIPGIYFSGAQTDIGFQLAFSDGGRLASQLKYDIEKSTFDIHLDLEKFALSGVLPYLQSSFRAGSLNGFLETHLDLVGELEHIMNLSIKGSIAITDFDLRDDQNALVLAAQRLFVGIDSLDLENSKYFLNEFSSEGLTSRFIMGKNGKDNFSYFMKDDAVESHVSLDSSSNKATATTTEEALPKKEATSSSESSPMLLSIAKIAIKNSKIHFENKEMQVPFIYDLTNFSITSDHFDLNKHNKVEIKGLVGSNGKANILWQGNIYDFSNLDLKINLQHLSLKDFTPYTLEYTAYPISKGLLSISSHNTVKNNMLNGNNGVHMYKCTVDKARKDIQPQIKVPLRTALYILKDRKEEIKIDLPIEGNINSPEFSYKKIILKTLTNLLVKVAMAPFDFLSQSIGFNVEQLQEITFDSKQNEFTPVQYDKFNQLSSIVLTKPELILHLKQYVNYEQAVRELSIGNLKQAYYLSKNTEKLPENLNPADEITIAGFKDNDMQLMSFANQQLGDSAVVYPDIYTKAIRIYQSQIDTLILNLATKRNQLLSEYLLSLHVLPANFTIETVPFDTNVSYKGHSLYRTTVTLQGEEPFIAE